MKKIKGEVSLGLVGCTRPIEFEMEDDATPEEIAEAAREAMFQEIEFWYTVDGKEPEEP